MRFDLELNGRRRSVSVERADPQDRYRVVIDDIEYLVDARRPAPGALSIVLTAGPRAGRSAELGFEATTTPGELEVRLPPFVATARIGREGRRRVEPEAEARGVQQVVAPMPGRVVRVLVAPGDEVTAGQGVVVVEAMKMENQLVSPKSGRVTHVAVTEGTSVEAGRVLVSVE